MRRCSSSGSGGCVVDPHWQPNTTVAAGWERVSAAHIPPPSGPLEPTERHLGLLRLVPIAVRGVV